MPIKYSMALYVMQLLKSEISDNYFYHNLEHTMYVTTKAVEIAEAENCNEAELDLVKTAALWHDVGYVKCYDGHEEISCLYCKQTLPKYNYSETEINIINGMIMATKVPQKPTTLLEKIIADADLAYLGTSDAAAFAHNLFKELQTLNPLLTAAEWTATQIKFLTHHSYFTKYGQQHLQPLKQQYLNSLH